MGSALANEAERRIGAATLHIKRVISWFKSSSAGERLFSHDVKVVALHDRSFIDSGQTCRRNKAMTSLVITSCELPGSVATSWQVSCSSLNTARGIHAFIV